MNKRNSKKMLYSQNQNNKTRTSGRASIQLKAMGRITIFSMDDCPRSLQAMRAFEIRHVPFTEICLSGYPRRRQDMMSLSNKIRAPQVFLNSTHIGGADEAIKLMKSWDKISQFDSPLETYENLVGQASDPIDPRLEPPVEPPVVASRPSPRNTEVIKIPSGANEDSKGVKKISVLAMTELLKQILPRRELKYNLTTYRNAFKAFEFVDCLMKEFKIQRDEAVVFAQTLQADYHILQHVVDEHKFSDTNGLFFRLHCDQSPDILNSYRVWTDTVDPDSMALLTRLTRQLDDILADHTDASSRNINYKSAGSHKDLPAFNEAVCELQRVCLENMPYATKLAFCINLYNMMLKYAFVRVGIATTDVGRNAFYSSLGFNVGGDILTFQDLSNGIMRGNRKAPNAISRQFGSKDSRLRLVDPEVDCRIHFCLTYGANSSPTVYNFTSEYIEDELRIVANEFCENKNNVEVNGQTLYLSKMFSWYMEDFGGNAIEIAKKVLKYLRGSKAAKLRDLIAGGTLTIKYTKFDRTPDASDYVVFSGSAIKSDASRFM